MGRLRFGSGRGILMEMLGVVAGTTLADWHVDGDIAVSGDGKTLETAFKTIAELSGNWAAGESVWIQPKDDDSAYREEILIPGNGCSVLSDGVVDADTGEMTGGAIIDASNIAANASFTKSAGLTNVYQITVTIPTRAGETNFINVWEDNAFLTSRASTALVDANAGSVYVSAQSGEVTIYIHATDSSSVITNGKVYEYSARIAGVYGYVYSGCTVQGLTFQKPLGKDGAIKVGASATVTDCVSAYGSIHNIYRRTGWSFTRVVAKYYYHTGANSYFIHNENTPNNEGGVDTDCWAISATAGSGIGWHGHKNTSGSFGAVSFVRCHAVNCGYGFQGNDAATITCTDCVTSTCNYGYSLADSTVEWNINGDTHVRETDGQGFVLIQATFGGGTVTIDGSTVSMPKSSVDGYIRALASCTINLTDSALTISDAVGAYRYLIYGGAAVVLTINASGNDYTIADAVTDGLVIYSENADTQVVSDNNHFSHAQIRNIIGATLYSTVGAWQAAGFDEHSTVG